MQQDYIFQQKMPFSNLFLANGVVTTGLNYQDFGPGWLF